MSSSSINKVILIGNLGKDPEIRKMQNGKEMASFSIATSESWLDKSSGDRTEKTEWHNVVVFNEKLVTIIREYVHKGSKVYIEGSLRTRKWSDANSNDRYTTEVILQGFNSVFCMLDSKGGTTDKSNFSDKGANFIAKDSSFEKNHDDHDDMVDSLLIDDEIPF